MAEVSQNPQDREVRERVRKSVDDIVNITNKVYETTQQLAKSANTLAKAGQESINQNGKAPAGKKCRHNARN